METKRVFRAYSNRKILAISALSFLCAFTMLLLSIIFISSSRPSFSDLSKFTFVTLCIAFVLFITYGVCAFIKDDSIQVYGTKTLIYSFILFVTVLVLGIISLVKSKDRVLPTIILSLAISVAAIIFFVNLQYFIANVLISTLLLLHRLPIG